MSSQLDVNNPNSVLYWTIIQTGAGSYDAPAEVPSGIIDPTVAEPNNWEMWTDAFFLDALIKIAIPMALFFVGLCLLWFLVQKVEGKGF